MTNHAHQADDWRQGFAKRAENFPQVCALAQSWRWSPGETVARISAAVLKGTPTLTIQQRMTLLIYVEHLNQERLEQDTACVWPSSHLVASYLGCSERQARENRRALEAAGFMVRDYTRANRPAGVEAYDLRPLLARLAELDEVDGGIREALEARRAAYSETVAFPERYSAQEAGIRHLEQSQKNFTSSVRGMDAATPRHRFDSRPATRSGTGHGHADSGKRHLSGKPGADGSPRGASGFGSSRSDTSVYAEMVRQELRAAAKACPRLAPLVTPALLADPLAPAPEDAARVAAAAAELLPQPERNNDQTAMWGWRKHGARVLVMLAIAVEDPDVRSPCGYFGKLTGQDRGAADLRLNLALILKAKGQVAPPEASPASATTRSVPEDLPALMFAPGVEDEPWPEIAGHLRAIVREGAWGSWFGQIGFHGISDGVITLSTSTGIAAEHIKRNYLPAVLQAAEAAEVFVERVVLTVRKR